MRSDIRCQKVSSTGLAPFPAGSFDGMLWLWTSVKRRLLSTLVLLNVQGAWSEVHREEPDEHVVTGGAPGDRLC